MALGATQGGVAWMFPRKVTALPGQLQIDSQVPKELYHRIVPPPLSGLSCRSAVGVLPVDIDTQLQVTVSGNSLIITPVNVGVGRERVLEAIEKLRPRYGEMLERLAE